MGQDLADILDLPVERPDFVETTALGAAMLAGVGAGLFGSLEDAAVMRGQKKAFDPCIDPSIRQSRLEGWRQALRSEEQTSELQSLMRNSYAVFCLKKKRSTIHITSSES